jgi:hypothetical protein
MTNMLALLDKLKTEMPELWGQAQVVGKWVWLEFNVPPLKEVRSRLKEFGFHWNGPRKCWQHPCGIPSLRASGDPRSYYQVTHVTFSQLKSVHAAATWANNARHNFWSVSPKIFPAFLTGISRISVRANASNSCVSPRLRPSQGARTV